MTTATLNWIDLSNFSGRITVAQAQAWKTAGVVGATVGCQDVAIATQQGQACQAVGLIVDLYAFLYWGKSVTPEVDKALQVGRALGLTPEVILWLDCEATPPNEADGQTPGTRLTQLLAATQQIGNAFRPGIYTGGYYWKDQMGNSPAFKALPLWDASYFSDHRLVTNVDFGGWTQVARHQYQGSTVLSGVTVDLDDDINLACAHTEGLGDDVTEDQVRAIIQDELKKAVVVRASNFRQYLDLAVNGGQGQFADANGNPLPLIQDKALLADVNALKGGPVGLKRGDTVVLN